MTKNTHAIRSINRHTTIGHLTSRADIEALEAKKIEAEIAKLNAETAKIRSDTHWHLLVILLPVLGAVLALVKLFVHN